MQYLRLSQFVGGKERNFDPLKRAIMEYDWDFVMVDEAHEGIDAAAGVRVMNKLKRRIPEFFHFREHLSTCSTNMKKVKYILGTT